LSSGAPPTYAAQVTPRHTLVLVLGLCVPLAGCESTVPLGSECLRFERGCGAITGPDQAPDEPLDSGGPPLAMPEAGTPDAALPPEPDGGPAADGGPTGTLGLQNGSFEITSEPPEPGSLNPLSADTEIAPWYWCGGNITIDDEQGGFAATEGTWMMALSFGAGPAIVAQALSSPLVPGTRYAFAVDAGRSASGPDDVRLELIGTNGTCTSAEFVAESAPLGSDAPLQTYCLSFVAEEPYEHVALRMNTLALTATAFVDNLRAVDSCP
jgi:hypothetical protein